MKTLNFIYQETEIHFALQNEGEVMVNATEMAKLFNQDVRSFLKREGTKKYIKSKLKSLNNEAKTPHYNEDDLFITNKKGGTLMSRSLALKFAAWLDPDFEVWVFDTIDNIIFGHYKEHWEAHKQQEAAKMDMESIKNKLLLKPTPELAEEYFRAEARLKFAKSNKVKAIRNQLNLF